MRVWGRERRIARCPQGVPAPAETIGSTLCARHGRRAALDGSPAKPSKPAWGATSGGGPSDDIDRRRRFPRGGARCPTLAACVTTVYRDGHAPDGYRRPTAGRGGAGRDGGAPNSRGWWRRWRRRDAPHAGQRPGAGGAPPRRCAGRPRPSGGRRSAVSDGSSCWLRHERLSSPSAGARRPPSARRCSRGGTLRGRLGARLVRACPMVAGRASPSWPPPSCSGRTLSLAPHRGGRCHRRGRASSLSRGACSLTCSGTAQRPDTVRGGVQRPVMGAVPCRRPWRSGSRFAG